MYFITANQLLEAASSGCYAITQVLLLFDKAKEWYGDPLPKNIEERIEEISNLING